MARRLLGIFGWLAAIMGVVLVVAAGLVYVVLQTQPGHDFVLRTALSRTADQLDGDVRVGSLRSDGLLRGFTLHDVAVHDSRGRPFFTADSLRVRYAFRQLLEGRIVLVPAELWRPSVVLETLHGDEHSNVVRILRLDEPRDDPEELSGLELLFRDVRIVDGEFLLRLPLEGDELPDRVVLESVPGTEGLHRRVHFTDIQAHLREADILQPDTPGERLDFERLSLVGQVLEEPFVLEEFRGVVRRVGPRLQAEADRFWLPDSELAGSISLDWGDQEEGLQVEVEAEATILRLADLRWLEPRLPDGEGRLDLEVSGPLSRSRWRIRQADLRVGRSRVRGEIGFDLGETLRLVATDVEALPLHLDELQPWLEEPLPVSGRVRGRMRASGPFSALEVDGELSYDDPEREIPASTARLDGTLVLGSEPGVRGLTVEVDPLRYPTLTAFAPELAVEGRGRLQLEISGSLPEGLRLAGSLTHELVGEDSAGEGTGEGTGGTFGSRLRALGSVRQEEQGLRLDLTGNLAPLSLDGVAAGLGRDLPVRGEVSGPVSVSGLLTDLTLNTELETPAGRLAVDARFDATDPGARYRANGRVEEFALHRLVDQVPDPTVITGAFRIDGRGITAEELAGSGRVSLAPITVAGLEGEGFDAAVRVEEGVLRVDTLELRSELVGLTGRGELALRRDAPEGEVTVEWEAGSLAGFRPLILGSEVIAADTLSELERLDLEMQGVDPDTLPSSEAVAMEGRARGELHLRGGLYDLDVEALLELEDGVYADLSLPAARIRGTGRWVDRDEWEAEGVVELDSPMWGRYAFQRVDGQVDYSREEGGEAEIRMERLDDEWYRVESGFAVDTAGVDLTLHTVELALGGEPWTLDAATTLRVEGGRVRTGPLRLSRPSDAEGGLSRIALEGTLALEGTSDLQVEMTDVAMERLATLAQMTDPPGGILDLDLDLQGPHDAPEMDGSFRIRDFSAGGASLSLVEGELDYRDRLATVQLDAQMNGRRLLRAEGRVPVDLSFAEVADRFPDRNVALELAVDSLPAATALSFVEGLEGVQGVLDGRIDVRGTPRALMPSGEIRMRAGAFELPEQGLRVVDIGGSLQVREDRTVEIVADARARGTARVEGTISMAEATDPGFDLRIDASGFQAVDRRDLSARVGGSMTLTGSYTRPQVGGEVRVDQGSIFLEEFARTAEVVDLNDPAFFDVVDTTLVATRPVVASVQNPFLQNLRVDVDLVIQRDFWLRSREMNVEMGGELAVTFDRPRRELLLVGTLEAIRGSYVAFGRQFQVRDGTVEFVGTPGIDPSLEIEAVNRLRREGGEPLDVVATVGGTLMNPRVELSSDAQPPIAESDLISYLIFGRPSYALASGESSVLEGAAGVGVSVGLGAVATQLGSVVARQFGVDYFTITQSRDGPALESMAGLGGTFADTQIEVGQYVGENLFLALILRPLTGLGARTHTQFPGARLEWRFADLWTLEGFVEDRFAREAASGFGELGLRLDKVLGMSIYREWGY